MIDLRSDTVTRPTGTMRAAMADAEVGDDVYGEDPTVRELEEQVAATFGHEAALFCVSGSLANLLAVRALVPVGAELLCETQAHIVRAELGAHSAMGGVTTRTWSDPRGLADPKAIEELIAPDLGPFLVKTAAISVENTHNFCGGTVQPIDLLRDVRVLADRAGVAVQVDGARIWNASVASGTPLEEYGRIADVMAVCLSKGLGAPVGSLVIGSADVVAEARVWRKRLGAGWRQAGVLAAAGLHALAYHVDRLAEDHANARLLAEACGVDPAGVETNMVIVPCADAAALVTAARAEGVFVGAVGPRAVRLVTHFEVSTAQARSAAETLSRLLGR